MIPDPPSPLPLWVYLADQHEEGSRSMGITRMTRTVLAALEETGRVVVCPVSSRSSMRWQSGGGGEIRIPWSTRSKPLRLLGDHLHPWLAPAAARRGVWYYPKGFMPVCGGMSGRRVITVHDTILQHHRDHYPESRSAIDYRYWLWELAHSLGKADRVLTVSEAARRQIEAFMQRGGLPPKEVTVTYEPCAYESIAQPVAPAKDDFVLHLGSCEPHKKSEQLIRWWHEAEKSGRKLPLLRVVGAVPSAVEAVAAKSGMIERLPFLTDEQLQAAYRSARALVFPSEIEGFGLPALEAYYLGTPVCFVKGTSVAEVLDVATSKGGFSLNEAESLFKALDEVLAMSPEEIRDCGLKLRETYAKDKVVARMMAVFEEVAG